MNFYNILRGTDCAELRLAEEVEDILSVARRVEPPLFKNADQKNGDCNSYLNWDDLFSARVVRELGGMLEPWGNFTSITEDKSYFCYTHKNIILTDLEKSELTYFTDGTMMGFKKIFFRDDLKGNEVGHIGVRANITLFPECFILALAKMEATGYYLQLWEDGGNSKNHIFFRRDLQPAKIGVEKKTLKPLSR